ncbi:uncharacterized protein TNCV_594291 [Trichonephila clavipes]|nr:uncharacterized protein TNCV_594291 [Trichonephila clavipes]
MDQLLTVLFTDESNFTLNTDSHRAFIWSQPGTCYLPSNVREIENYGGEGFMLDGLSLLHVFERGSVIDVRYRDEVLEPYVRFFFRSVGGPEFI